MSEFQGINSREELSLATCTLLNKTRKLHMSNGVTLIDPSSTYISIDAKSVEIQLYIQELIYKVKL